MQLEYHVQNIWQIWNIEIRTIYEIIDAFSTPTGIGWSQMLWVKLDQEPSGEGEYLYLYHLQWDKSDYSFLALENLESKQ